MESIRVLVADDQALVRDAICRTANEFLSSATIFEAESLDHAIIATHDNARIDLAVLALRMPGMDGPEGVKTYRRQFSDIRVAVLSGYFTPREALEALEYGAAGFIPKTYDLKKVFEAIQMIIDGHVYIPPIILEAIKGQTGPKALRPDANAEPLRTAGLTPREIEILGVLSEGCSNKEIANRFGLQEVTVKLHLRSIYRKLGIRNRTQAARLALLYAASEDSPN
jgi:DNA-binding NarL/FixJ family response regulator